MVTSLLFISNHGVRRDLRAEERARGLPADCRALFLYSLQSMYPTTMPDRRANGFFLAMAHCGAIPQGAPTRLRRS